MLLEVRGLTKEYKRGENSFSAVDNAELFIEDNDFICITGRSGSGKSTFLNMLAGLLNPTYGSISLMGMEYSKLKDKELSYLRNNSIGYIPQGKSVLSNFSVLDNIRLPFYLSKRQGDPTKKALSLLEEVGIPHLAKSFPSQLSGGELRRVSIARALINSPRIIIADEPTGDLDAQTTKEVMQLFFRISNDDAAVLLVTHDSDITAYANRLFDMSSGKLTEEPKP